MSASLMPGCLRDEYVVTEILLCPESYETYESQGLNPSMFPYRWESSQRDVPMKYISKDRDDHSIAAAWYIRALNKDKIKGPPCYLVEAVMPMKEFLNSLMKGDIVIYANRSTVAFLKTVKKENYPGIELHGKHLDLQEAEAILGSSWIQPKPKEEKEMVEYDDGMMENNDKTNPVKRKREQEEEMNDDEGEAEEMNDDEGEEDPLAVLGSDATTHRTWTLRR